MIERGIQESPRSGRFEEECDMARRIQLHIEKHTRGRIHGLHVKCSGGGIVLHGHCRTYHAKQLAQEAALEMAERLSPFVNEIVVG